MNKLERLSLHSALKIRRPRVNEFFYPIVSDRYICMAAEKAVDSRKYAHLSEVASLILPFLKKEGVSILDISEPGASGIEGAQSFKGSIHFNHRCFLIRNSELFCGSTGLLSTLAGTYNTPCVTIYSDISPDEDICYWGDRSRRLDIIPETNTVPSHSVIESPKTINTINPLFVAKSILDLLDIEHNLDKIDYYYIGDEFDSKVIEVIPDFAPSDQFVPKSPLNLRFDYYPDYKFLLNWSKNRNLSLFFSQDNLIEPQVLSLIRESVSSIFFNLSGEFDLNYLSRLKRSGFAPNFFCTDPDIIDNVRVANADLEVLLLEKKSKKDLDFDSEVLDNSYFKSGKLIISNGKRFQSKAHWILGLPIDGSEQKVIDSSDFWEDLSYYILYTKND